jgi:hypothetical protein
MIGYRFWKSIRWNSTWIGIRKSRLDVLWILVESGALYSITTIFLLGFAATNTGGIFAVSLGQISVRCSVVLFPDCFVLKGGVGDTKWDFYVLGIGPDTDHCTSRAERLVFVFDTHTCEGIHHRLGLTATRRPV